MKNFFKILLAPALALAIAATLPAQVTTSQTTTTANYTTGQTTLRLTTTTGMASAVLGGFNTELFIDQELMGVITVVNSTTVTVQRGIQGTRESTHLSGALVWFGPPNYFSVQNYDPTGSCTAANNVNNPIPYVVTGNVWTCPTAGPRASLWTLWYPNQAGVLPADSSLTGTVGLSVCHAQYSFAVDGGAVGLITPANNCTIPKNAIVYQGIVEVGSTTTGSTGNVSVGLSAGAGGAAALLAATARGSLTTGLMFQSPPVQTTASASNTSYFKMSAAGTVTVTVSTNALTAGILDIYVFYVVPTV